MDNTIGRILRHSARGTNAALSVIACASLACRTLDASRTALPHIDPPAMNARPSSLAPLVVDAPARVLGIQAPARVFAIEAPSRVVLTPSGGAYLVLRAEPEQLDDDVAWNVLYYAAGDGEEPARPGDEPALASAAHDLLEAFGPFADAARAGHLSVTALFGRPGESGTIEQRWFLRGAEGWRADGGVRRLAVGPLPAIDTELGRDRDDEARARGVAAEFISAAERADYDAAWSRTSALAKAMMSRNDFERRLSAFHRVGTAGHATPYLAFPASGERFLPGAFVEAWLAPPLADGSGVEVVVVRLDDDMEWRVASILEVTAGSASPLKPARRSVGTEL